MRTISFDYHLNDTVRMTLQEVLHQGRLCRIGTLGYTRILFAVEILIPAQSSRNVYNSDL